jgi:hypothetical protein
MCNHIVHLTEADVLVVKGQQEAVPADMPDLLEEGVFRVGDIGDCERMALHKVCPEQADWDAALTHALTMGSHCRFSLYLVSDGARANLVFLCWSELFIKEVETRVG